MRTNNSRGIHPIIEINILSSQLWKQLRHECSKHQPVLAQSPNNPQIIGQHQAKRYNPQQTFLQKSSKKIMWWSRIWLRVRFTKQSKDCSYLRRKWVLKGWVDKKLVQWIEFLRKSLHWKQYLLRKLKANSKIWTPIFLHAKLRKKYQIMKSHPKNLLPKFLWKRQVIFKLQKYNLNNNHHPDNTNNTIALKKKLLSLKRKILMLYLKKSYENKLKNSKNKFKVINHTMKIPEKLSLFNVVKDVEECSVYKLLRSMKKFAKKFSKAKGKHSTLQPIEHPRIRVLIKEVWKIQECQEKLEKKRNL